MAEAIHAGALRAGDRLPSVRRVSTQHRVSIATAVQAYRHLENQRLIEARPKSGYFVLARPVAARGTRNLGPAQRPHASSASISWSRKCWSPRVIPMSRRSARRAPDRICSPMRSCCGSRTSRDGGSPHLLGAYPMSPGNDRLRAMIARRSLDFGCRLSPDEIIVTNGCIEALNLALRAVARPGRHDRAGVADLLHAAADHREPGDEGARDSDASARRHLDRSARSRHAEARRGEGGDRHAELPEPARRPDARRGQGAPGAASARRAAFR